MTLLLIAAAVVVLAVLFRGSTDKIVQDSELRSWKRIVTSGKSR